MRVVRPPRRNPHAATRIRKPSSLRTFVHPAADGGSEPFSPTFGVEANVRLSESATELRQSRAVLFLCDVSSRSLLTRHRRS